MKQKLIIIGAGNIGGFIAYNISSFGNYELLGFLDDDPAKVGTEVYGAKVLGNVSMIDNLISGYGTAIVIGIGNPAAKRKIAGLLEGKKLFYPNFIGPNVWISEKVTLGEGVILYPGVSINYETVLQDFAIVNMNCAIGHNCLLEQYCTLAPGVNLAGFTKVGSGADVGIGATTIQGISIGRDARIGGQAMLLKDVPENSIAVGNPARVLRSAESSE